MTYSHWQAGLHFQQDSVVCVALQRTRFGLALRRWWQIPLAKEVTEPKVIAALCKIRREMPRYHRIAVALPAADTLQKQLPPPQMHLRESEQVQWIVNTVAQQLEMPANTLAFDFHDTDANSYSVTAARQRDISLLQQRLRAARLNLFAITPDACALQNFLPWVSEAVPGLCWRDGEHWLWATRESWGSSPEQLDEFLPCTTQSLVGETFNPWFPLNQLQPPLPENGDAFAIALALAVGVI